MYKLEEQYKQYKDDFERPAIKTEIVNTDSVGILRSFGIKKPLELLSLHNGSFTKLMESDFLTPLEKRYEKKLRKIQSAVKLYGTDRSKEVTLTQSSMVFEYIKGFYFGKKREEFGAISIDSSLKVKNFRFITAGTFDKIENIYASVIIRNVIIDACPQLIVCHNHPSGDTDPSIMDIEFTKYLEKCCKLMDIKLLDHLIVAGNEYISMQERGDI